MRHTFLVGLFIVTSCLPLVAKEQDTSEPVVSNAAGTLPMDKGPVVLMYDAPHLKKKEFARLARRDEPLVTAPDDTELPRNFRASVDNSWHHDFTGPQPSIVGMDSLQCSGSAEFSVGGWNALFERLRSRGAGHIAVIDLRQEAHGLVNNMAVSWYTYHDSINRGLTADEVMSAETDRLELLEDTGVITVSKFTDKSFQDVEAWRTINLRVRVKQVQTEYELVTASASCDYFRIAAPDYMPPRAADVDRFVVYVRELEPGTWLHFHCCAGQGRTTTFMTLYDMMRNYASVSADDIVRRQYLLGGINLAAVPTDKPAIKQEWAKARTAFIREFYQYCKENGPSYDVTWSQWKSRKPAAPKNP